MPGPRYTSYPTALQFGPMDSRTFREGWQESPERPLSLYVHLPFCRSVCLFCGCHAVHTRDARRAAPYLAALKREIATVAGWIPRRPPVVQMHWGGGTPTFLSPAQVEDLGVFLRKHFDFAPAAELGVEVDPRVTSPAHLEALRAAGFNRISLGVQDLDPSVQEAVRRIQPETQVRELMERARSGGFGSVSVDLIYGLPRQTGETFARTVERVIDLAPDRVSLFHFAYLPERIRHQRAIRSDELPGPLEKAGMFAAAAAAFLEAGYTHVGMDHFARPEDDLCRALEAGTLHRNFQGYTTHAGSDLVGFGASAISSVGRFHAQNEKDVAAYERQALAEGRATARGLRVGDDDLRRRAVIMELMCRFAVEWDAAGHQPDDTEREALERLALDGLVEVDGRGARATDLGRYFIRNIAMVFDAYAVKASAACSRTA